MNALRSSFLSLVSLVSLVSLIPPPLAAKLAPMGSASETKVQFPPVAPFQ